MPRSTSSTYFAAESIVVAPCVGAQLDALQGKLVDGATRPVEAMHEAGLSSTYVVRFPDRPWPDLAWTSVSTNDGLQLLDDRTAYYARAFYSQVGEQRRRSIDATTTATQLNALSVMMPRDADSRLRFIESIERLRSQVATIGRVGGQLRDDLAAMNIGSDEAKIRKDLVEQSGTVIFCRAHGLPVAPLNPGNAKHAS